MSASSNEEEMEWVVIVSAYNRSAIGGDKEGSSLSGPPDNRARFARIRCGGKVAPFRPRPERDPLIPASNFYRLAGAAAAAGAGAPPWAAIAAASACCAPSSNSTAICTGSSSTSAVVPMAHE